MVYGSFVNYLQVACHKAKIEKETHAGHQSQVFLMFFNELQTIFMVLVHLHCIQSREIRICMLISSAVISHKRDFSSKPLMPFLTPKHIAQGKCTTLEYS